MRIATVGITVILFAICVLCACGPLGSATSEAKARIHEQFEQQYSKCGDSYFGQTSTLGLVQFNNVTFSVKQYELNDADKLNGVEWKGLVAVNSKLMRRYDDESRKWLDWCSGFIQIPDGDISTYWVEKRRDQWVTSILMFVPSRFGGRIDCNQIPN